jgi:hypothetical protein
MFLAELHLNNTDPRAKDSFKMLILRSADFNVGNLREREFGIEINRAIGIAHSYSNSFDRQGGSEGASEPDCEQDDSEKGTATTKRC